MQNSQATPQAQEIQIETTSHRIAKEKDESLESAHHNLYKDDDIPQNKRDSNFEVGKITANNLISWIRDSLATNKLELNSSNAKIHMVKGNVFLASPAIFQQFVLEQLGQKDKTVWKALQNEFQPAEYLIRRNGGHQRQPLFTFDVSPPRRQVHDRCGACDTTDQP